jgi:serine/threonine-protein kinase
VLNRPAATPHPTAARPHQRPLWTRAVPVIAGVLVGAAAAVLLSKPAKDSAPPAVTRFAVALPQGQRLILPRQAIAISPDGTRIVFATAGAMYLRSMTELEPRMIPGTTGSISPVFSPDGQSLAFWTDGAIKRTSIGGGGTITVCTTLGSPSGLSWSDDGIVFTQPLSGVMRVSPSGGKPEVLVGLSSPSELVHGPQLLPGGSVLFTSARRTGGTDLWDKGQIVVYSRKSGERKTIVDGASDARYLPTGHIVYAVGGTLLAAPFNLERLATTGGAVPIVEGVARSTAISSGAAHWAFSDSGSLVYLPGPASPGQQDLIVFDRKGVAETLKLPPGPYVSPRVSPDGTRIAFETSDRKEAFVSIYELSGASSARRLTFGGSSHSPIWSPDGRRVAFESDREGDAAVFWQPADGGSAERLTKPDPGTSHVPESWSPSGDTILFSVTKGSESSLWTLSTRDRKAAPFGAVTSTVFPTDAAFSPDGRWVAYQIGEPGAGEATTFVEPFPPTGTKYQVGRGGRAQWSRDGRELFYVPAPSEFTAVAVRTQPSLAFSNPVAVPRVFGVADPAGPRPYDILPDGRIVGVGMAGQTTPASDPPQIQVVLNWFEEVKARAPRK